jgi:3-phenylpropionate/cinnamic acid dioxygenase small subunit
MRHRADDPLSAFLRARADVVLSDLDHSGGLDATELLAWRAWFDERCRYLVPNRESRNMNEIQVMGAIDKALASLQPDEQKRVLRWALDKFGGGELKVEAPNSGRRGVATDWERDLCSNL